MYICMINKIHRENANINCRTFCAYHKIKCDVSKVGTASNELFPGDYNKFVEGFCSVWGIWF